LISGCPDDISVNADPLLTCGANVKWNPPSATDNCTANLSTDHESGTFFPVGETTVTYTATDLSGNILLCSFNVTVIDNLSPTIATMNDITVPVGSSSCVTNVSWNLPSVTDNCNLQPVTTDITSGSLFSIGSTPVTITAKDTYGNTSTQVFNVIVVDDISPVITAMPDIIVSPTSGCNAIVTWLPPSATDNCVVQPIVSDFQPGSIFVPGNTTVTYTATDINGNSSTESFDVVVTDNVPPVINCLSDITASATSGCGANVTWSNPAIIDCSNYIVSSSHSSGDFFPTGTSTVIYTVTDAAGNSSSCNFNVIINDFTAPVFSNCPAQVNAIANSCEAGVTWAPPSATDNCNVSTIISTHTSGAIFPIGSTRVSYTAVDGSGNTSSCSFDVIVTDGNSPVINDCPSNLTILVASSGQTEVTWVEPTASVGCGTVELTSTHKPGDVFSLGTTEVKYTATDHAGRTSQCSFNVETIYTEIDFTIADLVTPNGDGINDFWDLGDLDRFVDNNVSIVDRWGGIVYNASGYDNKTVVWNGQNKNGGTVPTGTYFYRISVRLGDSKVERNGFIELVR
jgi:gliding motility-associated-like protein